MNEKIYQGWSNRETWIVVHRLHEDRANYEYWRNKAMEHRQKAPTEMDVVLGIRTTAVAPKYNLAAVLHGVLSGDISLAEPSLHGDLLNAALLAVRWDDIAEHLLADDGA